MKVTEGTTYTLVDTHGAHVLIVAGKGCIHVSDELAEIIRVGSGTVAVAQAIEQQFGGVKEDA